MNQELRNAVTAAEKEAQYDASAKRLLGNKKILAHILVSTVPLELGLTNQRKQETGPYAKGDRIVGLSKNLPERSVGVELHRLLGALLSRNLPVGEKLAIMEDEYEISMEKSEREDVSIMCNLSQGIKEEGFAEGLEAGRSEGREAGIQAMIEDNREEGIALERIKEKLMRHFGLDAERAEYYIRRSVK